MAKRVIGLLPSTTLWDIRGQWLRGILRVVLGLLLLVIMSPLEAPLSGEAGDVITRWASGEVIATDTVAIPNTILVRSKTWKGQDFIVGAAVEEDTIVTIGNNRVKLEDVKVGDKVDMVYERNIRVIAKSIRVRR